MGDIFAETKETQAADKRVDQLSEKLQETSKKILGEVFKEFDANHDDRLSPDEFKQIVVCFLQDQKKTGLECGTTECFSPSSPYSTARSNFLLSITHVPFQRTAVPDMLTSFLVEEAEQISKDYEEAGQVPWEELPFDNVGL